MNSERFAARVVAHYLGRATSRGQQNIFIAVRPQRLYQCPNNSSFTRTGVTAQDETLVAIIGQQEFVQQHEQFCLLRCWLKRKCFM